MNDLLTASLNGGLFILVILLLRALCKQRLPRTAFVVLWLAAVFRLLCPVKLPFAASVWNLMEQDAPSGTISSMPEAAMAGASLPEPAGESWSALWVLWAVIALCLLMGILILYARSLRSGRKARRIEPGVYVCQELTSPRVCGILRPRILLPESLDQRLLPYVLLHERVHARRLDNLWKLLALTAAAIHWFNPASWILVILLGRDLEVACDEWALRRLSGEERSRYALSLIDIAERCEKRAPLACGFSYDPLEERIRCMMKRKQSMAAICAAAVMILGATAVFATDAPADENVSKAEAAKLVEIQQSENGKVVEKGSKQSVSVKEYQAYMAQEKERMKKQAQEGHLSQENYEKTVEDMEKVLESLKNGTAVVMLVKDENGEVTGETIVQGDLSKLKENGMRASFSMNASTDEVNVENDVELRESSEQSGDETNVNGEVSVNLEAVE